VICISRCVDYDAAAAEGGGGGGHNCRGYKFVINKWVRGEYWLWLHVAIRYSSVTKFHNHHIIVAFLKLLFNGKKGRLSS